MKDEDNPKKEAARIFKQYDNLNVLSTTGIVTACLIDVQNSLTTCRIILGESPSKEVVKQIEFFQDVKRIFEEHL